MLGGPAAACDLADAGSMVKPSRDERSNITTGGAFPVAFLFRTMKNVNGYKGEVKHFFIF